jgi:hypothetical protein
MTVREARAALKAAYPQIDLEYESANRILTLRNLVRQKRFGMGYAWHAFLTLEDTDVVDVQFECHTSDTTTGVFHQKLPATKPIWERLDDVCKTIGLHLKAAASFD